VFYFISGDCVTSTKSAINLKQDFHYRSWELRQASAPAARASPIAIVPYYLYLYVPPIQVMLRHRNAPRPPRGGLAAHEGAAFFVFSEADIVKKILNWLNTYPGLVVDVT
jgi:hypothetical protein